MMKRRGKDLMVFEELHNRYGSHVARRVQNELTAAEFEGIAIDALAVWLERRAEGAHKEYQTRLDNPFINEELGAARTDYVDVLYRRWQDAEELAYLVAVAEDVSAQAHVAVAGK
jgi:hypothetical protein